VLGALALQTARSLASGSEAAQLSVLHHRLGDPVDTRIIADGVVVRVDKNDLEVLVRGILVDPIRVEHTEIAAAASHSLLSLAAQRALPFELIDTLGCWLTEHDTLADSAFAATTSDTDTVDDIPLLGLVSESASLVRTSRSGCAVNRRELSVLPAADAKQKLQDIRLLLLPKLLEILVGTHCEVVSKCFGRGFPSCE